MSNPTPAALRAARAIVFGEDPESREEIVHAVARVIDTQTGLPELLAALELAGDCLFGHHYETSKARLGQECDICAKRSPSIFSVIQAAIAKAKGDA